MANQGHPTHQKHIMNNIFNTQNILRDMKQISYENIMIENKMFPKQYYAKIHLMQSQKIIIP